MMARYHEIRALMHQRFPTVFTARNMPAVPLKVGIYGDLRAAVGDEVPEKVLRAFLGAWTVRIEYQQALTVGGPRYDLGV